MNGVQQTDLRHDELSSMNDNRPSLNPNTNSRNDTPHPNGGEFVDDGSASFGVGSVPTTIEEIAAQLCEQGKLLVELQSAMLNLARADNQRGEEMEQMRSKFFSMREDLLKSIFQEEIRQPTIQDIQLMCSENKGNDGNDESRVASNAAAAANAFLSNWPMGGSSFPMTPAHSMERMAGQDSGDGNGGNKRRFSGSNSPTPDKKRLASGRSKKLGGRGSRRPGRLSKSQWSKSEDQALVVAVQNHGPKDWSIIAASLEGRCGKQCRERWLNHLSPDVNKDDWAPWEDELIFKAREEIGNRWADIAKLLPGRSDNSVKNRYYAAMRRRERQKKQELSALETARALGNKIPSIREQAHQVFTQSIQSDRSKVPQLPLEGEKEISMGIV